MLTPSGGNLVSASGVYTITVPLNVGILPPAPQCDSFETDGTPDYKGWEGIADSAASFTISFSAVALMFGLVFYL